MWTPDTILDNYVPLHLLVPEPREEDLLLNLLFETDSIPDEERCNA